MNECFLVKVQFFWGETYNFLNSIKKNPSIGSYQIVEYVALVSCDVSVSVECFDNKVDGNHNE